MAVNTLIETRIDAGVKERASAARETMGPTVFGFGVDGPHPHRA